MSPLRRILFASLALAVLSLAAAIPTYAGAVQLLTSAQLTPGGSTTDYPGNPNTNVPSPLIINVGGNTVTFTVAVGNTIFRADQGNGFDGDFAPGTELLVTFTGDGTPGTGPLTINFATGVGEFGIGAQNNAVGTGLFTFSVFNNATLLGTFTQPGNGFISFLGARATDGDVITRVTISGSSTDTDPNAQNNFAVAPLTFGAAAPAAIPEPTTMLLLSTGLVGVAAKARKRRQARKSEEV
jgi:hypothetical protein